MGRPAKTSQINAEVFSMRKHEPESLEREIVKTSQIRHDTETIIYGEHDALPLIILDAINKSPTATTCLGKVSTFMRGDGFSDKGLMSMPVDKDGTTLYDLHSELCEYMTKLEGFSVRFMFDYNYKITESVVLPLQSVRFVKPSISQSKVISKLKYNPYFGTQEYQALDSKTYHAWNLAKLQEEINEHGTTYNGQVYYYGSIRPPYNFYPVPKYWSGQQWIYTDAYIQSYVKEQLDNGFFQSSIIKMIGDPNQPSKNPKYQKEVTGTDGVKRKESNGTTVAEEFSEVMKNTFSGHKKAGTAMVLWSMNKDDSPSIESFPANVNLELIGGTMDRAIRGITIATEVQAILANLPQQASSLGSDGEAMRAAVELMYSRVRDPQIILENFYNNVLLANHASGTKSRVKIVPFQPLSGQIQVPDKVWEWMNDDEKAAFVKSNVPQVTIIRQSAATTPGTAPTQTPDQTQATAPDPSNVFSQMGMRDIDRVMSIAARFNKGKITEQVARETLKGYGLNDAQIQMILFPDQNEI